MLQFEWDDRKARVNQAKHKVSFEEASTVFGDPRALTVDDRKHSATENRFITVGRSYTGQILIVVHTDRADRIRFISSRPASRKERLQYETL